MSNDLLVLAARADLFTRALIARLGEERLFWKTRKRVGPPEWDFQTTEVEVAPGDAAPPDGAIVVSQTESAFSLQGPRGMAVDVWTTPPFQWFYAKNKKRARPAMFVAHVAVDRSVYCTYAAASEERIMRASGAIPLPEEVDAHEALLKHKRALEKALKACHFRVVNAPSTGHVHGPVDELPRIERFPPKRGEPGMWSAGIYWEEALTLERKEVAPFVDAVARLLDTPLACRIQGEPGGDPCEPKEMGTKTPSKTDTRQTTIAAASMAGGPSKGRTTRSTLPNTADRPLVRAYEALHCRNRRGTAVGTAVSGDSVRGSETDPGRPSDEEP